MAATVEQPSMGEILLLEIPAGQDLGHALFLIGFSLLVMDCSPLGIRTSSSPSSVRLVGLFWWSAASPNGSPALSSGMMSLRICRCSTR